MKQTKQFKLILDFAVTVDDSELAGWCKNKDQFHQQRLLEAILSDEQRYRDYIHSEMARHSHWYNVCGRRDSFKVIEDAIRTLSPLDQDFFNGKPRRRSFERIEPVQNCFITTITHTEIIETNQ